MARLSSDGTRRDQAFPPLLLSGRMQSLNFHGLVLLCAYIYFFQFCPFLEDVSIR